MVGGLVEQQHVGRCAPAPGASATRLCVPPESVPMTGVLVQVQPLQGFLDALLPVPAVLRLDRALQRVEVALRRGCTGRSSAITSATPARAAWKTVGFRFQHRFLRHIGDAQALLQLQDAVVRLLQARQDLEERGLAGAIAPDQADAFAGFEREIRVVEQRDVAEGQLRVEKGDQCHGGAIIRVERHGLELAYTRGLGRARDSASWQRGSWDAGRSEARKAVRGSWPTGSKKLVS